MTNTNSTVEELKEMFKKLAVIDVEYNDGRVEYVPIKKANKLWSFITDNFVPRGEVEKSYLIGKRDGLKLAKQLHKKVYQV